MATTWVLETQTKGTGATMVPLEDHLVKPSPPVPGFRLPKRRQPEQEHAEPRGPLRFRLVDIVSRQILADDVDARVAVTAMQRVRSIVDVSAYLWDYEADRWRLMTLAETRALWEHRGAAG